MNLIEIVKNFPTELDAVEYLEQVRWSGTIHCPECNSTNIGNRQKDMRYPCRNCGNTFSVKAGTQLDDTRLPMRTWLMAFAVISDAKKGISAKQLERNLGVHYETAWNMYHKIRDLMSIENNNIKLAGIVELDTKQVSEDMRKCQEEEKGTPKHIPELDAEIKKYKGKFAFKQGSYSKPCRIGDQPRGEGASRLKIAGAVTRDGDVVAHVIQNTGYANLKKLVNTAVNKSKSKTVLLTDEARSNKKFSEIMNQIRINHFRLYSYRGLNTNTIESFWAIIERQIKGQHHHVDIEYLEKYVAEAVFKFNNRKDDDMFETLCALAMTDKKVKAKKYEAGGLIGLEPELVSVTKPKTPIDFMFGK